MSSISIKQKAKEPNCIQKAGLAFEKAVKGSLEKGFQAYGAFVAKKWWAFIIGSLVLFLLTAAGRLRKNAEVDTMNMWVPKNSDFKLNSDWLSENNPSDTRTASILAFTETGNILSAANIKALSELHQAIDKIITKDKNTTWEKQCERRQVAGVAETKCVTFSILELFMTNGEFDDVSTLSDQDVLDKINDPNAVSGLTGQKLNLPTLLGMIKVNVADKKITGASAVQMHYSITFDLDYIDTEQRADPTTLDFEWEFIQTVNKFNEDTDDLSVYPNAVRSIGDINEDSINGDLLFLTMGFGIVGYYVMIVLGKFNTVQHRAWLSQIGIACVGMGFLSAEGTCSAFGLASSPMNSILPFMLLGIGIDDMFVIVQSFDNVNEGVDKSKLLTERFGLCMKHAGVAILITSITDMMAFGVGASTILPALRSFCIFSTVGILFVFTYMVIFFLPFFVLDQKRQEDIRDGIICCWKKKNWTPNNCSQKSFMKMAFEKLGDILVKLPVKIVVLCLTAALLGLTIWGVTGLETEFDFKWYIEDGTYLRNYFEGIEEYFPISGIPGQIYIGEVPDFDAKFGAIKKMMNETAEADYLTTVNQDFVKSFEAYVDLQEGPDTFPETAVSNDKFYEYLGQFLCSSGASFQRQIKFKDDANLTCSGTIKAPEISILTFSYQHESYESAKETIEKINLLEDLVAKHKQEIGTDSKVFVYSFFYSNYKTTEIISEELVRNILLALLCVFIATLFLIANLFTSLIVVVSVLITLVNVGGFMNFWGLTVDTLTAVLITISLGLAVDYSAHIAHAFMTCRGTRNERVKETMTDIGPAVLNGGFSTFLAIVLLIISKSYIFTTFFKIFFLIVVFGLFNGLIFLPVLLSLIGPGSSGNHENAVEPTESFQRPTSAWDKENSKNGVPSLQNSLNGKF